MARKPYPSDVTDEEWDFVVPYLTLMSEDAPQREHGLREVFDAMRWVVRTGSPWRYMPHDLPPWQAVDTLGHLLALHVTAANEQDRDQAGKLAEAVQKETGGSVGLAHVDQGYTGERAAEAAGGQKIELSVVKLPGAKRGFVLLPRRWVAERASHGWRGSAGWPGTTSDWRRRSRGCTSPPSRSSCWLD
jgi:transposase